tara:strand:+ start:5844 stop:5957 length:114 start_codon:yes stop_codon:yes gene_type:complete
MKGGGPRWIKLGNTPSATVRYELADVEAWEKGQERSE